MTSAVVVGSGPNGLAAAVTLAQAGLDVTVVEAADRLGGGARTEELTDDGLLHDHCSAVHPLTGSAFMAGFDAARFGLRWCQPEVDLAHPLEDGTAGVLVHSLPDTVAGLGPDGPAWQRLFGWLTSRFDDLLDDVSGPVLHVPRHPVTMGRFGRSALLPATVVGRRFTTPQARALFSGVAAHALAPLERPTTAAIGMTLAGACHRYGWVVAEGGSQSITDAMAKALIDLGGHVETGMAVRSLDELPDVDVTMLDLSPSGAADVAGDRLPARTAAAYRRWRYGPAAYKVDFAIDGGIPWTSEAARRAGTVHVGGTSEEIAFAEREIAGGRMPDRPFVLVGQQYLADPSRSIGDLHPVWTYAHVPSGWDGDGTDAILAQLERFAPGVRDRVVRAHVTSPAQFAASNPNVVNGDISMGANTPWQLLARPRLALDPYATGAPGIYLCSAATPPGAGAHGLCGYHAARSALRHL